MKSIIYDHDAKQAFPILARTVGDFFVERHKITRAGGIRFNQVFLVRSGKGILVYDSNEYELRSGDMFFILANAAHAYWGVDPDDPFVTSYIGFDGYGVEGLTSYYGLHGISVFKGKSGGRFSDMISRVYGECNTDIGVPELCADVYQTVVCFFDEACKSEKESPFVKVRSYIEQNYSSQITLDELVSLYPYSKSKFCQDFKLEFGMSAFEMLNKVRLKHAKTLLANDPAIRIRDVANRCGYEDESYFCKMYKREYGISPRGIRE